MINREATKRLVTEHLGHLPFYGSAKDARDTSKALHVFARAVYAQALNDCAEEFNGDFPHPKMTARTVKRCILALEG